MRVIERKCACDRESVRVRVIERKCACDREKVCM